MNASSKLKLGKVFTVIVAVITAIQGFLTTPPFTAEIVHIASGVITFFVLSLTYAKGYFSPEISATGERVTLVVFIIGVLTGLSDLLNVFTFSDEASRWITWGISLVTMIVNLLLTTIWPSLFQREKKEELERK